MTSLALNNWAQTNILLAVLKRPTGDVTFLSITGTAFIYLFIFFFSSFLSLNFLKQKYGNPISSMPLMLSMLGKIFIDGILKYFSYFAQKTKKSSVIC